MEVKFVEKIVKNSFVCFFLARKANLAATIVREVSRNLRFGVHWNFCGFSRSLSCSFNVLCARSIANGCSIVGNSEQRCVLVFTRNKYLELVFWAWKGMESIVQNVIWGSVKWKRASELRTVDY